MKKIILVAFILIGLCSCNQNLTCKDFMTGDFYVPIEDDIERSFKITRNGNSQIEITEDDGVEQISYAIIDWINECTYRLKYDESKMEFDDRHKFINSNNGVLVEKIEINGNCFLYKSTMIINGEEKRIDGKIYKK